MIKGMDSCLFSYIASFKVLDKNHAEVGRVGDVLLNKDTLDIDSLIVRGGFIEEKLEDLGVKEDVDPIVPASSIDSVSLSKSEIILSESKDELKNTTSDWSPPDNVHQFSKLKKTPVLDSENKKMGTIIDMYWESNNYVLVIGGSWLEEFLESIKIFADKDLIVPKDIVTEFSLDQVKISVTQNTLKTTLSQNLSANTVLKEKRPGFVPRGGMNSLMVNR
jgi:sporulation protein YlmC with PRC-barrel domain